MCREQARTAFICAVEAQRDSPDALSQSVFLAFNSLLSSKHPFPPRAAFAQRYDYKKALLSD